MTTTVTSLIGTGGAYSTLQLWEDACPANLVTADQIWRGECKNQDLSAAGGGNALTISGTTTDATRYLELTTQAGASFVDNANAQTNALRFDSTKGASATCTGGYNATVIVSVNYTRIGKLMLAVTAASSNPMTSGNLCFVDQCIFEANGAEAIGDSVSGLATFRNCLFVQRGSAALRIVAAGADHAFYNCTFVVPSDKTAATYGIDASYSSITLKNCAVFGATSAIETGNSTFTITTCRTDQAAPPAGFTQIAYNTTTGSGFENTTDATRDFRIKSTSAMIDVGTTDATNAASDIVGTARPQQSAYDIGAWEWKLQSVTCSPGVGAVVLTGQLPISRVEIPVYGSIGQFDPQLTVTAWF